MLLWSTQEYKNIGLVLLILFFSISSALCPFTISYKNSFLFIFREKRFWKHLPKTIASRPCFYPYNPNPVNWKNMLFILFFFHLLSHTYINIIQNVFKFSVWTFSWIIIYTFAQNIAVSDITSSSPYRENKIILLYFDSSVLFETTKPFCVPLNERKCRQRFIIQEGKVHTWLFFVRAILSWSCLRLRSFSVHAEVFLSIKQYFNGE